MLPIILFEPTSLIVLLITLIFFYVFIRTKETDYKHHTREPPIIPSKIPFFGHMFTFGKDPLNFLLKAYQEYGPVFTFTMLGKKFTYLCDTESISSFFNGKNEDLNAEEIYGKLVTPVFGTGVVYDVPHNIFMEQKKMIKSGLVQARYRVHVPIIERETLEFVCKRLTRPVNTQNGGLHHVEILERMSELIIFTSSACLMGKEVRAALTEEVAQWYTDLDGGFCVEAWLFPGWLPFPAFKRRDLAHQKIKALFMDIIAKRRQKYQETVLPRDPSACPELTCPRNGLINPADPADRDDSDAAENDLGDTEGRSDARDEGDMITTFMNSHYKDGRYTTDDEIAKLMISLLMAGQHTSSTTTSWLLLFLAKHPEIQEAIYQDITDNCELQDYGADESYSPRLKGLNLDYDTVKRLELLDRCLKETLRLRPPLLTLMRMCKRPLSITSNQGCKEGRVQRVPYVIPPGHQVCVSPTFTHQLTKYWTQTSRIFNPDRYTTDKHDNDEDTVSVKSSDQQNGDLKDRTEPRVVFCPFNKKTFEVSQDHPHFNGIASIPKPDVAVKDGSRQPNDINVGKFSYIAFGAGRHRCVGESFAYVQIKTIVAVMVANYKFHLCTKETSLPPQVGIKDPALAINHRTLISTPLHPEVMIEPRWGRNASQGA